MKKILCAILAVVMLLSFAACGSKETTSNGGESSVDVKVGLICLHDENSTYDNNFIQALKEVQTALGLKDDQVLIKTNIDESDACYNAAAELVEAGCDIIFADSFGHESFMIQAAKEFPDVQFCHATGTKSQTEGLAN
ncbi:MAG: BMP family ABC transporter substrate-binding protein, partial [Clostridia bacterium]|nr:BMP family ABC transporter substrate-binding protein [Clostridia bacterium]